MKAFKAFTKPFEAPQSKMKMKFEVIFLSLFEHGMGRVNILN